MFRVGGSVIFTMDSSDIQWLKFPDAPDNRPVLRIRYEGSGLALVLSPIVAERMGELKVWKTYLLTAEQYEHRGYQFYGIKATELLGGTNYFLS
jgi:hypothetical protein